MATTVWGSTSKPVSSRRLAALIEADPFITGQLYIGFPVLGTPEGAFPFDAVLLSPDRGVVIFDIVEGTDPGDYQRRQDEGYAKLQAKLLQYPALVNRRALRPTLTPVTFAPAAAKPTGGSEDYPVCSSQEITSFIRGIKWSGGDSFPALASAIQSLSTIRKGRRKRDLKRPDSRGAILQKLNDSIANLDVHQSAAVVETVDGVQRVRGLAGSGKTIVLALKVAYLHAQNADWRIAVTFNTRSLKGQFQRLVNTFVIEQTNEEPDWERIEILHSWGSPKIPDGMYYQFTQRHGVVYHAFADAKNAYGDGKEFSGACAAALAAVPKPQEVYDAILIDEAQDLPSEFLQMCYKSLKKPNRLVYAYDELQSLTNATLPPPEELFGTDSAGKPVVTFRDLGPGHPRQDIILQVCYRNSRPVLATAHALGFGIYRAKGLIATFDEAHLWRDVGYKVEDGALVDDQFVSLARTSETSPAFLESHSPVNDLITFKTFASTQEQTDWLVASIKTNLDDDELNADDIIVINPDPLKTRKAVSDARAALFNLNVNSSLAGVSGSPDVFFEPNVITFTGIFRAKGNEAGMVYIINAQDCFDAYLPSEVTRARSQLFTAITRSKAWVRVVGVGKEMDDLTAEYNAVRQRSYHLDFMYPNETKRKELRTINRDRTKAETNRLSKNVYELTEIVGSIDRGEVKVDELPMSLRKRLQALLGNSE